MRESNIFKQYVIEPLISMIKNHPDNKAFCINEQFYSFQEFGNYISKIRLEILKSKNESNYVGLVVNDDLETYASIFALWLENKAYIPLHPKQPLERNLEIIEQMGVSFILDSEKEDSIYKGFELLLTQKIVYQQDFLTIESQYDDEIDCYVLFTSGSTGKPKGVVINRKNIGAFLDSFWATGIFLTPEDRCIQTFDLTFDVSVQSFLAPLTKGACVFTVPHDQIKYSYVYGLLEDHEITFGAVAPSMLRYLRPYFDEIRLPKLKYCIVTAEASPLKLILEWSKCVPNAEIYNFYGPTEGTIYCTYYKIEGEKSSNLNGMLSIGKPLKNVDFIIVNDKHEIVSNGAKGELCISGNQITNGYWNDPEKNEKSFFYKEVGGISKRYYKTGDLCYFENDIMLYGRLDSQVKIQGYRIEIGEIEYHVRNFLNNANVVVIPMENRVTSNTELITFIEKKTLNKAEISAYLKTKIPSYMIPVDFIYVESFPLNNNGKIDKNKLKETFKNG